MPQTIIKLDRVWKTYKLGETIVNAVQDVSFDINKGDFLAILGASGSGKSTLMNLIGALDVPSKGRIFLKGNNIATLRESELANIRGRTIGFIFQQFNLIAQLSALENVMLPTIFQGKRDEEKAKELLALVGLGDRIHHKPNQLSGGQQQRVAIARALVNDPDVLLADEPTGNLDSVTGKQVMDIIDGLHKKQGKTIILVTHDINLVKHAHRTVHIKDGKIV